MTRLTVVLALVLAACDRAAAAPPSHLESCGVDVPSAAGALVAYRVEPLANDDVLLQQEYSATPPRVGTRFVVVDESGFVGIVVAKSAESDRRCSGCGCSVSGRAAWVEHPVLATAGSLDAIGPFRDSFRRIQRLVPEPVRGDVDASVPAPRWRATMTSGAWDLTGDGREDLEAVVHTCEREHARAFELFETRGGVRVLTSRSVVRGDQ